jgi:hypothetical protein
MPKWSQTTLHDAGDLVGDPADTRRTRSNFYEPHVSLITTEPFPFKNIFFIQSSYPQSYGQAAGNPFWESAMQDEYKSLLENHILDLVPLHSRRKLVICRWVYRTNSASNGQINRYKARLVTKGFQQVHGIDYDDTFTLVVNMDSIQLALSIAAAKGWEFHHMNMKNVFLHVDLFEEIYME